jgi:hypothetical protein
MVWSFIKLFFSKLTWQNITSVIMLILFIITALWGYGTAGSLITNIISPKFTPISNTFLLPAESSYDYCVKWNAGQQYKISVLTNEVPIVVYIVNQEEHQAYQGTTFHPNHFTKATIKYDFIFKPKSDGMYWIILDNRNVTAFPNTFMNKDALVNFSVEATDICSSS